ncbi:MAG: hypothetical protein AAFX79_01725 [Planctomycetota bacterium]
MTRGPNRTAILGGLVAILAAVPACEYQELSVTPRNSLFHRLSGEAPSNGTARSLEPSPIRVEHPDGTITLFSRSGRDLMVHIRQTLIQNERDLFTEQILSDMTREEFLDRNVDPEAAFDELKARQRDVMQFFGRIGPFGEHSPMVFMEPQGGHVMRIRLTGMAQQGLRWTFMDMVLEEGSWRLRWFG